MHDVSTTWINERTINLFIWSASIQFNSIYTQRIHILFVVLLHNSSFCLFRFSVLFGQSFFLHSFSKRKKKKHQKRRNFLVMVIGYSIIVTSDHSNSTTTNSGTLFLFYSVLIPSFNKKIIFLNDLYGFHSEWFTWNSVTKWTKSFFNCQYDCKIGFRHHHQPI